MENAESGRGPLDPPRCPRGAVLASAAVAVVAALAVGHARVVALDRSQSAGGPDARRAHVPFATRLVAATTRAEGPVYDPPLPRGFAGFRALRAHDAANVLAPEAAVVWTSTRSEATSRACVGDPILEPLVR